MKKTKVFFDASVLFAALYSARGASFQLAMLARQRKLKGLLSLTVIEEVEHHLDKFPQPPNIHQFIYDHAFIVRDHVQPKEINIWKQIVDPEDAHVLAGAVSMSADYLVTLDKKHFDKMINTLRKNWLILQPVDLKVPLILLKKLSKP